MYIQGVGPDGNCLTVITVERFIFFILKESNYTSQAIKM